MNESYLDRCLAALPPAKQATARQACKDLLEGAPDDSTLAKLLIVLEANSAYAQTIPQSLVGFGEKFLRELDARNAQAAQKHQEQEAARDERLSALIAEQVPELGRTLALDKVAAGLDAQTTELGRLERSVSRLRHARVGGMLLILGFGLIIGAGSIVGLYWRPFAAADRAKAFVDQLSAAGIHAQLSYDDNKVLLSVDGPTALRGTAWRKNSTGYIAGADFVFSSEAQK